MSFRILVTAAGGALAPLNIRLMKAGARHDVEVVAVDLRADAVGRWFADHFETVPAGDDPGYGEAVVDLVTRQGIDLVLPWSDEEALALAAMRDRIAAAGAVLACAATETLGIMNDKGETYRVLEAAGIDCPRWRIAETPEALDAAIAEIDTGGNGDGFVIKPTVGRGNRGTLVVRGDIEGSEHWQDSRELHMDRETFRREQRAAVVAALPVMVMERLYPPAFDIDVLARSGEVLRAVPRRRLNPAGVPFRGSIIDPRADLLDLAGRVTRALDLSWLYDYDIMCRADGSPAILELNPRPSGSIAAAIIAGIPFYDDLISLAKGEALPPRAEIPAIAVIPWLDCSLVPLEDLS